MLRITPYPASPHHTYIEDEAEYKLIVEQRARVANILRFYGYHAEIYSLVKPHLDPTDQYSFVHHQWSINTLNSYFDTIISNSNILFRTDQKKDKTYLTLSKNQNILKKLQQLGIHNNKSFKQSLLTRAGISNDDFEQVCKTAEDYRNNTISHSDNFFFSDPKIANALEHMAKIAHALGEIINELLLLYPEPPSNHVNNNIIEINKSYRDFTTMMILNKKAIYREIRFL